MVTKMTINQYETKIKSLFAQFGFKYDADWCVARENAIDANDEDSLIYAEIQRALGVAEDFCCTELVWAIEEI